jgi:hypothetical protein
MRHLIDTYIEPTDHWPYRIHIDVGIAVFRDSFMHFI